MFLSIECEGSLWYFFLGFLWESMETMSEKLFAHNLAYDKWSIIIRYVSVILLWLLSSQPSVFLGKNFYPFLPLLPSLCLDKHCMFFIALWFSIMKMKISSMNSLSPSKPREQKLRCQRKQSVWKLLWEGCLLTLLSSNLPEAAVASRVLGHFFSITLLYLFNN